MHDKVTTIAVNQSARTSPLPRSLLPISQQTLRSFVDFTMAALTYTHRQARDKDWVRRHLLADLPPMPVRVQQIRRGRNHPTIMTTSNQPVHCIGSRTRDRRWYKLVYSAYDCRPTETHCGSRHVVIELTCTT